MSEVRMIPWHEHPEMAGVLEAIRRAAPFWQISDPYTPGRDGYHTFLITDDGMSRFVYVEHGTLKVELGKRHGRP